MAVHSLVPSSIHRPFLVRNFRAYFFPILTFLSSTFAYACHGTFAHVAVCVMLAVYDGTYGRARPCEHGQCCNPIFPLTLPVQTTHHTKI
jgi:hypothetical protein